MEGLESSGPTDRPTERRDANVRSRPPRNERTRLSQQPAYARNFCQLARLGRKGWGDPPQQRRIRQIRDISAMQYVQYNDFLEQAVQAWGKKRICLWEIFTILSPLSGAHVFLLSFSPLLFSVCVSEWCVCVSIFKFGCGMRTHSPSSSFSDIGATGEGTEDRGGLGALTVWGRKKRKGWVGEKGEISISRATGEGNKLFSLLDANIPTKQNNSVTQGKKGGRGDLFHFLSPPPSNMLPCGNCSSLPLLPPPFCPLPLFDWTYTAEFLQK